MTIITLKKFGTTLLSRQSGRKDFLSLQSMIGNLSKDEIITVDFEGVNTFSPSWGDEFLTPLLDRLGNRLVLLPSDNLSVQATLNILEEANKKTFIIKD